jgi:hypothetical protein
MEQLRLGVLAARERFDAVRFEGKPVEFFPHNQSLPPPADKPKKKEPPPQRKVPTRGHRLSDERALEIWRLHDQGCTKAQIQRALKSCAPTINRVLGEPRLQAPEQAAAVSTAEGQRLHLLEWAARFAGIEFDGEPGQGKPVQRRRKTTSTADYRQVYSKPYLASGSDINSHQRRPQSKPQPHTNLHTRPSMVAQSIAQLFADAGGW